MDGFVLKTSTLSFKILNIGAKDLQNVESLSTKNGNCKLLPKAKDPLFGQGFESSQSAPD